MSNLILGRAVLALMLNVVTSTNPTATKVDRSVTHRMPENQPQWLGFGVPGMGVCFRVKVPNGG